MSNKPRIHAFCNAGCKWETVHKDDFERSAAIAALPKVSGAFRLEPLKTYRIKKSTGLINSNYGVHVRITYTVNGMGYAASIYNPNDVPLYDRFGQPLNFDAAYKEFWTVRLCGVFQESTGRVAVIDFDGDIRHLVVITTGATTGEIIENAQLVVTGTDECYLVNEFAEVRAGDGDDGDSVFVRFSASEDGSNFTETWTDGQNYIGFATGQTAPTDKAAYTWCRFVSLTSGEADPGMLHVTDDGEGNVTVNGAIVEANETPVFDLVSLGLPVLPLNGDRVSVETDTTEIAAALKKGGVKFRVSYYILPNSYSKMTAEFFTGASTVYDGVPYACCCQFETSAIYIVIEDGKITAKYIDKEPTTNIDMSAFDTEGKIVETNSIGVSKTTTIEFDENGNPVKIKTDGQSAIFLTW